MIITTVIALVAEWLLTLLERRLLSLAPAVRRRRLRPLDLCHHLHPPTSPPAALAMRSRPAGAPMSVLCAARRAGARRADRLPQQLRRRQRRRRPRRQSRSWSAASTRSSTCRPSSPSSSATSRTRASTSSCFRAVRRHGRERADRRPGRGRGRLLRPHRRPADQGQVHRRASCRSPTCPARPRSSPPQGRADHLARRLQGQEARRHQPRLVHRLPHPGTWPTKAGMPAGGLHDGQGGAGADVHRRAQPTAASTPA